MRCAPRSTTVSGAAAKEMGKHAEALTAALQQKLTLVEYFKSDNALLQNSLRYFTHTGQNIGKQFKAEQNVAAESAVSHVLVRFICTSELDAGEGRGSAQSFVREPAHAARSRHANRTWLADCGDASSRRYPLAPDHRRPTTARADALQNAVLQYANSVEARAARPGAVPRSRHPAWLFVLPVCATALECPGPAPGQYRQRDGERQQAVAALRASEERFRAITESANDAIISADSSGNIVSWNARAEAIFGYTAEKFSALLSRV